MKSFAATLSSLLLVAICLNIGVSAHEGDKLTMREAIEECAKEINMNEEKVRISIPPQNPEAEHTLGCITACALKKRGMLIDNKIQVEKMQEAVNHMPNVDAEEGEMLKARIVECAQKAEAESDECGIGVVYGKCYISYLHNKYS